MVIARYFIRALIVVWVCTVAFGAGLSGSDALKPSLTPQRLHRLRLEKQRQTIRWMAFENRVQTVPDSPERGFELALYYAITQDEQRGREAVAWAAAHPDQPRQRAIVANWCASLVSDDQRAQWSPAEWQTVEGDEQFGDASPNDLAALLLLSPTPHDFDHPTWQVHVRALALVAENPNLPNTQFLQSWVLQQDQTIREGPGVGYEFFWADPYLPGVSYQNMEPWIYTNGRLLARTDWTPHACWVSISAKGVDGQGCPQDWRSKPMSFGHLKLLPVQERCMEMARADGNTTILLWRLAPDERIMYRDRDQKKQMFAQADAAGLLRSPTNLEGKVCLAR